MTKSVKILFVTVTLIAATGFCFGQCPNNNTFWMDMTPTGVGNTQTTNCIEGGEYVTVDVCTGASYTFQTCATTWDTQITLYNAGTNTAVGYNDDGCGLQSTITWTASFTGTLNVLVDLWNCQNNGACGILSVTQNTACSSGGGGDIDACSGNWYDPGGSGGNYPNNQYDITTICPDVTDQCVNLTFNTFGIENNWDYLTIYDGTTTGAPVIGSYTGTQLQGTTIQANNVSGCLTFLFESDGSNVITPYFGWSATLSCSECGSTPPASEQECLGGTTVCSDQTFSGNSSGNGTIDDLDPSNQGCLGTGENQSSWYLFSPASDGNIGFTISPGFGVDYDFAVWGPYPEGSSAADICSPTGQPIRCSYASGVETYDKTGSYDTGIGNATFGFEDPTSNVIPSGCTAGPCSFSVCLYDSFGDGWDAASLDILVNGTLVLNDVSLANGMGPGCYNFNVPNGANITATYTPGNWPGENSFTIFSGPNGTGDPVNYYDSPVSTHSEDPGANGWVPGLEVSAGEVYILLIDNFSSDNTPFDLNWNLQGGATLDCAVLPVEMLNFTGQRVNRENLLEWQTASETNADYFAVERSDNARDFETIGQVPATGNSNTVRNYSYADDYSAENMYYRLKQVDFDGEFEYFGPVAIHINPSGIVIDDPFPNPANGDWINLNVFTPHSKEFIVDIQDMTGRLMKSETHQLERGSQLLRIDLSNCATGIYHLSVTDDQQKVLHSSRIVR